MTERGPASTINKQQSAINQHWLPSPGKSGTSFHEMNVSFGASILRRAWEANPTSGAAPQGKLRGLSKDLFVSGLVPFVWLCAVKECAEMSEDYKKFRSFLSLGFVPFVLFLFSLF